MTSSEPAGNNVEHTKHMKFELIINMHMKYHDFFHSITLESWK